MRLSKWKFQVFGLNFILPIIVKIHQKIDHDRAALLRKHKAEMAECARCHRLIDAKAGTSFLSHMHEHHKIAPADSYIIVSDVWLNLLHSSQTAKAVRERQA